jgi:integrase
MNVLAPAEIGALREAATPATYRDGKLITNNYRLLISFAVFTGCRVGEILGAAWSHIDWKCGQFHACLASTINAGDDSYFCRS